MKPFAQRHKPIPIFVLVVVLAGSIFCSVSLSAAELHIETGHIIERAWPHDDGPDMHGATAIAYDPYDDIFYVTDSFWGKVWTIDSDRVITTMADGLVAPVDAAIDPATGDLYVAEFNKGQITVVGSETPLVTGLGLAAAVAVSPFGEYVGDTYVADASDGAILFVNYATNRLDVISSGFTMPNDLLYDGLFDLIYVVDTDLGAVYIIDPLQPAGSNTFLLVDNLDRPLYCDLGFHDDLLVTLADGRVVSIDLTAGDEPPAVSTFATGFKDARGIVSLPISDQLPNSAYVVERDEGVIYRTVTDTDEDGIGDVDELDVYGTDPEAADTDFDQIDDGDEINVYDTDPLDADTDGDGLKDGTEILFAASDPLSSDTDDDGFGDGWEYHSLSSPINDTDTPSTLADLDADFLRGDVESFAFGTDPLNADTDGDGTDDWTEIGIGADPLVPDGANYVSRYDDLDSDALDANTELILGTDPFETDTDDDGVPDGREILFDNTDPLDTSSFVDDNDPDGDGLTNENETVAGTDIFSSDTDGDGLADSTEVYGDFDNDGLFGFEETVFGTDPDVADTDGDGVSDLDEALADEDGDTLLAIDELKFGTSDTDVDSDNDGDSDDDEFFDDLDGDRLTGLEEVIVFGTNPDMADTDGDGYFDGWEVAVQTDPLDPAIDPSFDLDLDDDGLTGSHELGIGTDPDIADTDGDGFPDGVETALASNPTDPLVTNAGLDDADGDGLADSEERFYGSDPAVTDTDGDGYEDGLEVALFDTDPADPSSTPENKLDRDADGLTGAEETRFGTDPALADTDNNGILDGYEADDDLDGDGLKGLDEALLGTDILDFDTDDDGVSDYREAFADLDGDGVRTIDELRFGSDPAVPDTDDDGVADDLEFYGDIDEDGLPGLFERTIGTDPFTADTDDDGLDDGDEHMGGTDPLDSDDASTVSGPELDDYDGDRLAAVAEYATGADPLDPDTDDDGLGDGDEVLRFGTRPFSSDTDGDGHTDGDEVGAGTDPRNVMDWPGAMADDDLDRLTNRHELLLGSDPSDPGDPSPEFVPGPPQLARVVVTPMMTDPMFVGTSTRFAADLWLTDGTQLNSDEADVSFTAAGAGAVDTVSGLFRGTAVGRTAVVAVAEYEGVRSADGYTCLVHAGLTELAMNDVEADPGDTVSLSLNATAGAFTAAAIDLRLKYDSDLLQITGVTPSPALAGADRTLTWSPLDDELVNIRISGDVRGTVPAGTILDIQVNVADEAPDTVAHIVFDGADAASRAVRKSVWLGVAPVSGRVLIESGQPDGGTPDLDGDGRVDAVDIQKTINQVLGLLRLPGDPIADIDEDGKVDARDIQLVINTALGVIEF